MKINREVVDDVVVLRFEGKMMGGPRDAASVDKEIDAVLKDGPPRVLMDLEGLTLINSTGLGILVSNQKRLGEAEVALKLVNVPQRIGAAMQITWLTKVFDLYRDEGEALASFRK